jgi:protein O-mannosyl-transferase
MDLSTRKTLLIQITLIIILGFSIYANSFSNKFIWDDEFLVKDNVYIKSWVNVPHFFTGTIGMGAGREGPCYRPLQMLTFIFDHSIWRLNVFGYHLTNVLLHILVTLTIYWLVYILYNRRALSFLTSILFMVHPIHTETVDYISGRADSLSALFVILCLICYIKQSFQRKTTTFVLIILTALAAMLSKEAGLIVLILLFLYSYTFKKKILTREFVFVLIISLAYLTVRSFVIRSMSFPVVPPGVVFQRIPGFCVAVIKYLGLLFLPFNLHMEYGNKLFSFRNFGAMGGITVLLVLLAYAFKKREKSSVPPFAIYWFFIALLPVSNLYPINAYMAEHWLYLPSLGFFLILSYWLILLYKEKRSRLISVFLFTFILSAYSYLTIKQITYWREPVGFYKKTLCYAPDDPKLYHNLGKAYLEAGNFQEAKKAFQKAIEIAPQNASLYNILGTAYNASGDRQNAAFFYQKAISINPDYADAYYNLGNTYLATGDTDNAVMSFKKAIRSAPKNVHVISYYNNLAYIYVSQGRTQEAISLYEMALDIDPDNPLLRQNIRALYGVINKDK